MHRQQLVLPPSSPFIRGRRVVIVPLVVVRGGGVRAGVREQSGPGELVAGGLPISSSSPASPSRAVVGAGDVEEAWREKNSNVFSTEVLLCFF